ncbi:hypothetical protein DCAR_0207568 [Daucus carota subsp. sativus]|uniref:Pyrrolo-quinoline quinone repeat domain-containing protein n=1 Tax=Daucus carota subsp. sativus TaxID=79200 RepID=A0AAF1AMM7_DAUCS|nr:hypothetical protein DCAR_0207568 [Daucus carota subsp. sativus]
MSPYKTCNKFLLLFHFTFILLVIATPALANLFNLSCQGVGGWLNHGGRIQNRRFADTETKISPSTVPNLSLKWEFYAGKDISATPAIYNGTIYFPSWNGYIYAVNASDGSLIWKQYLQSLTGIPPTGTFTNVTDTVSRSTPTVAEDKLIVTINGPAFVIAVKCATGQLLWSTKLDNKSLSIVTMSGTFFQGSYYVGTSSAEETLPVEQCCLFRGSFAKLNVQTGAILWRTFMLPDNNGILGEYAGAAIWGSSPSIDVERNQVYIATGNLYSVPQHVEDCQENLNNQTTPPTQPDPCVEPENHSNSILALDMTTGEIKWYRQLGGYDVWFWACADHTNPDCPPGPSPDADFGEAPMILSTKINGTKRDIVFAVQKSGFAWALDADNGSIVWSREAGHGGLGGGGIWGSATDIERIYTNIANSGAANFTLAPSNTTTTAGGWVAMAPDTGKVLWTTADPSNSSAPGPVTVANGVVFAGSTYRRGPIYAMNAKSGKVIWSYDTGATVYGGISVANGCIYVGTGYRVCFGTVFPSFSAGTSLFAFCL